MSESLIFAKDVTFLSFIHRKEREVAGKLIMRSHFLDIFIDKPSFFESIAYCSIKSLEKISKKTVINEKDEVEDKLDHIIIKCKDFNAYEVTCQNDIDLIEIHIELTKRCSITDYNQLPCFSMSEAKLNDQLLKYGWSAYNQDNEFNRMGFNRSKWVKSYINDCFKLCPTYPEEFYVPAGNTNNILYGSAKFRSKFRLPMLSYFYEPSGGAICRSSQPLSGLTKKSKEDVLYLRSIANLSPNKKIIIVDSRPMINAMANKAAGKGFEDAKNYPYCDFYFSGIGNIHVMRKSANKLFNAIYKKYDTYLDYANEVESSGWLKHIKLVLDSSLFVAKAVFHGSTVLVHCSDGWDRTSQTTAVASIILDPFYRTIHGFIVLIEKEFLSAGHMFSLRSQHIKNSKKNYSPIFLQFIDCVWQILQQFPSAFQFNEYLLMFILYHVYSCEYGNFLYNCVNERIKNKVSENTHSLWGVDMGAFKSPFMEFGFDTLFALRTEKEQLSIWIEFYGRGLEFPQLLPPEEVMLMCLNNFKITLGNKITDLSNRKCKLPYDTTHCPSCRSFYTYKKLCLLVHCPSCLEIRCTNCLHPSNIKQNCSACLEKLHNKS